MNVLHVWDSEYPWDVRAEKVSMALTEAGHAVHLCARNRRRDPLNERRDEATVHRMPPWRFVGGAVDAQLQFPAFFNPRWRRFLRRVGTQVGAEAVVVRDIPLGPTAVHTARRLGVPVILDMAENYPAMIQAVWDAGRQRATDVLVRNPRLVDAVERWVLAHVDHVVVVVEESAERIAALGVPEERITVSLNTPLVGRVAERPLDTRPDGEGPMRVVYLGLMEAPRGLATTIDAVARLRDRGCAVRLDLIGDGREVDVFRRRAASLELGADVVRFHGFQKLDRALELVRDADVGLVPHLANASWNSTIPNKLFDYMSMGLPVVTSDARPAARIVREVGCGGVFRSGDADDLAEALFGLRSAVTRRAAGRAGWEAVRDRFNWSVDGAAVVRAVEETSARLGSARP